MKIYRGPGQSFGYWSLTDSKQPKEYLETWASGEKIVLDGTIDKAGERHTDLGLVIEEGDVVTLFNALVKRYRKKQSELIRDLKECQADLKKSQAETTSWKTFCGRFLLSSQIILKKPLQRKLSYGGCNGYQQF
ncbi:hypothetical protein MYX82_04830 [Acidobacteria bacterium AH-259-D05]|nr:hypothetical protein [Acidobacteria bacterium AH-259-D05]